LPNEGYVAIRIFMTYTQRMKKLKSVVQAKRIVDTVRGCINDDRIKELADQIQLHNTGKITLSIEKIAELNYALDTLLSVEYEIVFKTQKDEKFFMKAVRESNYQISIDMSQVTNDLIQNVLGNMSICENHKSIAITKYAASLLASIIQVSCNGKFYSPERAHSINSVIIEASRAKNDDSGVINVDMLGWEAVRLILNNSDNISLSELFNSLDGSLLDALSEILESFEIETEEE